uniref:Small ribosomal subunit protein uS14c n=1 Tax=Eutreptia viridis TaxID=96908 RepID=H8ZXD8_9EUGL|nr:ribosomal protein S14 [Eutreptia viridis]
MSTIAREKKRQKLVEKFSSTRFSLKKKMKFTVKFFDDNLLYRKLLQALPKDSAPSRLHNRCFVTGRPKGYYRFFGLSRHVLREMAHDGLLPGVVKSSW